MYKFLYNVVFHRQYKLHVLPLAFKNLMVPTSPNLKNLTFYNNL